MPSQYRSALQSWAVVALVLALVFGVQAYQPRQAAATSGLAQVTAVLGHGLQAPTSALAGGDLTAIMGNAELDLRQVPLPPGEELVVDVLAVMGRVTVRVPDHWTVDTRAMPVMGGTRDRRVRSFDAPDAPTSAPPSPRLVLRGAVVMGGLLIRS